MKVIDLTLPDTFIFWDGNSHEGDSIEGRTIIQHVRSNTVIEVLDEEMGVYLKDGVVHSELKFKNELGLQESLILAVHYTIAGESQLQEILEAAKEWYLKYLEWEDNNILDDEY